jgi:hypothetical protein
MLIIIRSINLLNLILRVPDLRRVLTPLGNATLYVCMGT